MAETLSVPLHAVASSNPQWGRPTRSQRVVRVQSLEPGPELILRQSLESFDRARSHDEVRAARERLLSLGPEVLPSVIAELSEPQPPERSDVLLGLLLRWQSPDDVIDLALTEGSSPNLRAAMAEGMARYLEPVPRREEIGHRVGAALALLARDPDPGVRITAIEAIGLAGLAADPEMREILQGAATRDASDQVRREAQQVLDESA